MNAQEFAYWLQGFAELNQAPPTAEQWQAIKDHLGLVFNKVTPNYISPGWPAPRDFNPAWLPNKTNNPWGPATCSISGGASDTILIC